MMPTFRQPPRSIEYSVHPLALNAFQFISDNYQPIFHWEAMPQSLTHLLLQQQIYTGIMHSKMLPKSNSDEMVKRAKNFEFITPVWALKYTEQLMPLPENYLICYEPDELTDHQISLMTWNSIFQLLAFSVDRQKLAPVRDALNEMVPARVMRDLLSAKSLTIEVLAKWTGGSRATIVNQKKQHQAHVSAAPQSYSEQQLLHILTGQSEV